MDRQNPQRNGKCKNKQTRTYTETYIFTLKEKNKRGIKKEESNTANK